MLVTSNIGRDVGLLLEMVPVQRPENLWFVVYLTTLSVYSSDYIA
jgi:hypothetical protein